MKVLSLFKPVLVGVSTLALATFSMPSAAQNGFPNGPIRILVGFPAGGTIDVVARLVAEQMREDLHVPINVENLTGAGGQLAAMALKRAAADGKTLMVAPDHTMVVVPLTVANPGFDVATDFAPVGLVANYAGALAVSQASGIKDMAGWLALAKLKPETAGVGVASPGSKPQFELGTLAKRYQVPLTVVPYRGSAPLVQDLAGGQITAGITAVGDFLEFHKTGKVKVIAMVGDKRSAVLPDVPTASELGYPMKINFWIGMYAPAGTPQPVVDRLNQVLNKSLIAPKVRDRMTPLAFEAAPSSPAELAARSAVEAKYWEPAIAATGWVKQ